MRTYYKIILLSICLSVVLTNFHFVSADSQQLIQTNGSYIIKNEEDFNAIQDMNGIYRIESDIILRNPKPIGSFSEPFTGTIIGALNGDIKNKPTITIATDNNFTGLVTFLNGGTIKNLILDGTIKSKENKVSGFVNCAKKGKLIDCVNRANINCTYSGTGDCYVGGMIAFMSAPTEFQISGCQNTGNITCVGGQNGYVGGIGGYLIFSNDTGYITQSDNSGNIETKVKNVGGIAGYLSTVQPVSFCSNQGRITNSYSLSFAGGIAGTIDGNIEKSFNSGEIVSCEVGAGIAARIITNTPRQFSNTYNSGQISSSGIAAGILGNVSGKKGVKISSSYHCGKLSGRHIHPIAPEELAILKSNYYLSDFSEQNDNISAVTEEQLKHLNTLKGFSSEVWSFEENGEYDYPQLINHQFGGLGISYRKLENGYLYVEAEDGISMPSEVNVVEDSQCSENKNITFNNVHTEIDVNQPSILEPALSYSFELTEKTTVSMWIRVFVKDTARDSIFAAVDNTEYQYFPLSVDEKYYWKNLIMKELDAGIHTFDLFPREPCSIDRVLLSSDGLFNPSGLGGTPDDAAEQIVIHNGPAFKPIAEHPRIYFTKEDIPKIIENAKKPQNAEQWQKHLSNLENQSDGKLPAATSTNNFDSTLLEIIESRAFEYALHGEEEVGRLAVSSMIEFGSTMSKDGALYHGYYSYAGEAMHKMAEVYDWCHPLLTAEEKEIFHKMFLILAQGTEMGWPPDDQDLLGGHGGETQLLRDMLAVGIAMYDEYPYIYNNTAGRFFDEAVDFRKFMYNSHFHIEGDHYFQVRYGAEIASTLLLDAIGYPKVFGLEQQYVPYWQIYARRPDGSTLRSGDSMHDSYPTGQYYNSYYEPMFLTANYFKDPYLKREAMRENIGLKPSTPYANQSLSTVEFLIFNDPDLEDRSLQELPLSKYFPSPQGGMIARTGWEDGIKSPAVVAEMKMSEFWMPSHAHLDAGSFQIYYKGPLANDTGYYATNVGTGSNTDNGGRTYFGSVHFFNYYRRTIAHNCMLIYDPNEKIVSANNYGVTPINDGGQRYYGDTLPATYEEFQDNYEGQIKMAETLAHEYGIDPIEPNYTYLKGDLSYAYSDKISGYERSFMFLNLKNEAHPAAILVFDRVESSSPEFKKTWLLHGTDEPQINGTQSVLTNTREGYNGKLTVDTLLPEKPEITKVGGEGKDFWVNGTNWNGLPSANGANESTNAWRIEVSPSEKKTEDYFLNVLQVSDALPVSEPLAVSKIEAETHIGAKIADRVVLFGKQKERVSSDISFAFEGDGTFEITVADLQKGIWQVNRNGAKLCDSIVTEEGGIAVINADAGSYELKFIGSEGERENRTASFEKTDDIYLLRGSEYQYTQARIVDGHTMIPLSELPSVLNIEFSFDEITGEITLNGYGKTMKMYENSLDAKTLEESIGLNIAPHRIKGELYVPLRSVSEQFYYKIEYNEYPKAIQLYSAASKPQEGYATIIDCEWISNLPTSDGYASYDGNETTGWATSATEGTGDCEITYYFGTPQPISAIEAVFSRSSQRTFRFDVLISNDNENWTTIIQDGISVITEHDPQWQTIPLNGTVETTYVKFVGKGNSTNNANNLLEIKFKN